MIAQYSRSDTVYAFQRLPNAKNGQPATPPDRQPNVAKYLDGDWAIPARRFVHVKSRRAFINDPVPPLYLAMHLWARAWPTERGSGGDNIAVAPGPTAAVLHEQYRHVRSGDVKRALELLQAAGLAYSNGDGTWTVSRRAVRQVRRP